MSRKPGFEYAHIVITGASSGIGEGLACHYAAPGVVLSLTGRHAERLGAVAEVCRAAGAEVFAAIIDVADQRAMADFLLQADARRPVDLVIANAGIGAGTGQSKEGEKDTQVRRVFDVNLHGVLNTIHPLLPAMTGRGRGQIAIMSSLAGFRGWPGAPSYCASKAAVKAYGEGLRGVLDGSGVKVSVICPGFVVSRMTGENDFPMPFLMNTDRAVRIIAVGLARNKSRIAFPWPAVTAVWFLNLLFDSWVQKILQPLPSKPEFK